MSTSETVLAALIAALDEVDGLRLAVPLGATAPDWWPWDARGFAIDLAPHEVQVRVVAAALPLAPVLDEASDRLRAALADTPWSAAGLRLVVTDLDAVAFDPPAKPRRRRKPG